MTNNTIDTKPNGTGIGRVFKATECSILGFKAAFKHEAAFRQELLLIAIFTPIAWFTSDSFMHFVLLVAVLLMVLLVETINSAIEAVVDRIGLERHELSGRAKDLGSLAVMLAIIIAGSIWLTHLYNYFF